MDSWGSAFFLFSRAVHLFLCFTIWRLCCTRKVSWRIIWIDVDLWSGIFHEYKQSRFLLVLLWKEPFFCHSVTLAAVLKTDPVLDGAAGCPYHEKIALCWALKMDPAGHMTFLLCRAKNPMSMIYLVQEKELLSFCPCRRKSGWRNKKRCIQHPPQWESAVYKANKWKDYLRDSNPLCSTVH